MAHTPVDLAKARDTAYAVRTGAGGSHPAADLIDRLCGEVAHLRAENCDLAASSAGWAKRVPGLLALLAEVQRIVDSDAEWDIRIHGSAQARTTLRDLLDGKVRSDG